ncbi:MAG TPA: ATP-binding protein [Patescibacteria group bacterium]|nr:ATP-binding protein [Patescibacteria group bacterium]
MVKLLGREKLSREEKLEHERLTSLINSMADGVIAVDKDMRVVLSNGAALNVLDVNSSLRGRKLGDVFKLLDRNNQKIDVEKLVSGTTIPTSSRDTMLPYADGSTIKLYLSIAPVHLGYGKRNREGFVLLLRDITREKSLEEERNEFISVISHELRTPIAITEGNISNAQFVVEKSGDIKQIKVALKAAHDQTMFLAGLVNDLSMLSRAERGKLTLEIEPIEIASLLKDLQTSYGTDAKTRGLTFETRALGGVKILKSSRLYVREILQNFITNSLKYTEKGGVTITAEPGPEGVIFKVIDTGIGISKPDQEKLFDKFFRSEDYRTRKTNGTGLGLYVTLKLTHLIHAEIDVKSELNKGSTFTIVIPNLK